MSKTPALFLRVLAGAAAGARFRLTGTAVVGRSPDCSISIADPSLSRRHFELTLDGGVWRATDLQSRNGMSVNGALTERAVVGPGDRIQAGDVTFQLEVVSARLSETSTPDVVESNPVAAAPAIQLFATVTPALSAAAPAPADGTLLALLMASLRWEAPWNLYALIDGAQAFELAFAARLMGHELYTLFSGDLAETAAHVGPCLVVFDEPSAFLQRWLEQVGSHAGVLFESTAGVDTLCTHLRTVFVATDEEGQEYFFRFYDPRVLRTFLPTCREDELREFFGPIDRWIAETEDGSAFTISSLEASSLRVGTLTVSAP